ncbi:cytochrome P450 [Auricularia subglabra TFB-10046 SS5]|nr:cytochrome P450 [Auricularia subglabra TFB-10046 SS5]
MDGYPLPHGLTADTDPIPYELVGLAGLVLFFVVRRWLEFRARGRALGPNLPGYRLLIDSSIPLPWKRLRGVNVSEKYMREQKFKPYEMFGCDIYSSVSAFPKMRSAISIADPAVVKELTLYRSRFPKPVKLYHVISVFGPNIVASEFDEHKMFRKAVAPTFSERNNRLVWDEGVNVMINLFETPEWRGKERVEVENGRDVSLAAALIVIGIAGFGRAVSWADDNLIPPGHKMRFKEALGIVSGNLAIKVFLPRWAKKLRQSWRRVDLAFDELDLYMKEMIQERRNTLEKSERYDLFSGLLDGIDDPLTDAEVMGNVFIFLIAGHETTAHTLAHAFALLALYEDEQEKLYQEVQSAIGPNPEAVLTYDDMSKLPYALAIIYEALRMFPPVSTIAKYAAEDTIFTTTATRADGSHYAKTVAVPQGTPLAISIIGLHYNPRYWPNPHEFRPRRFLGDWPREAFMAFSAGARGCIGKRFSETEGVAILTTIVSRYKIGVKDKPEWAGLSSAQKRELLLAGKPVSSLT